jgi:hypothetical protein
VIYLYVSEKYKEYRDMQERTKEPKGDKVRNGLVGRSVREGGDDIRVRGRTGVREHQGGHICLVA